MFGNMVSNIALVNQLEIPSPGAKVHAGPVSLHLSSSVGDREVVDAAGGGATAPAQVQRPTRLQGHQL